MNSSRLLFASALSATVLLSSCAIPLTTSQINRQVCVARVRSSYDAQSKLPLKVTNVSVSTGGARVVVEGRIIDPDAPKHGLAKLLAAHLAAASDANAAHAAGAASATNAAGAVAALAVDTAARAASAGASSGASAAATASAPHAASAAYPVPPGDAGAECLFAGRQLTAFQWLAPAALAKKEAAQNQAEAAQ
jgi:hypothetical protein